MDKKFLSQEWGSKKIVSRGKVYYPHKLPGFLAIKNNKYVGLVTCNIKNNECEIVTLNSLIKKKGIGRDLVEKVKKFAKEKNCKRV